MLEPPAFLHSTPNLNSNPNISIITSQLRDLKLQGAPLAQKETFQNAHPNDERRTSQDVYHQAAVDEQGASEVRTFSLPALRQYYSRSNHLQTIQHKDARAITPQTRLT